MKISQHHHSEITLTFSFIVFHTFFCAYKEVFVFVEVFSSTRRKQKWDQRYSCHSVFSVTQTQNLWLPSPTDPRWSCGTSFISLFPHSPGCIQDSTPQAGLPWASSLVPPSKPGGRGRVHWFGQPSVYTVTICAEVPANISGSISPRDWLNSGTFQQWSISQPWTSDVIGECLKHGEMFKSNIQNKIYSKISTLLNIIYIYKCILVPLTRKWRAPIS